MLMCYFGISNIVDGIPFEKIAYKMLIRMNRLKQYWKQYRQCQRKTNYKLLLFIACKCKKTSKKTIILTKPKVVKIDGLEYATKLVKPI
jgi:hypothetical protein